MDSEVISLLLMMIGSSVLIGAIIADGEKFISYFWKTLRDNDSRYFLEIWEEK